MLKINTRAFVALLSLFGAGKMEAGWVRWADVRFVSGPSQYIRLQPVGGDAFAGSIILNVNVLNNFPNLRVCARVFWLGVRPGGTWFVSLVGDGQPEYFQQLRTSFVVPDVHWPEGSMGLLRLSTRVEGWNPASLPNTGGQYMEAGFVELTMLPANETCDPFDYPPPEAPGDLEWPCYRWHEPGGDEWMCAWVPKEATGSPISVKFRNPEPICLLSQFKSDGQTTIPVGGTTDESTVVFKANVSDLDGDNVKLQIELRRVDEYGGQFLNQFTQQSDLVASGSEATVTVYGLVDGNYHWQARTVDEDGLSSEWVEFGNNSTLDADFVVKRGEEPPPEKTLPEKAAELAKEVIGRDYRLEQGNQFTKGWSGSRFVEASEIEYLDCSGLVFWAYNKASGAVDYQKTSAPYNPVHYENADGQYLKNSTPIQQSELMPGDLLFFDWDNDGYRDHVEMYVGDFYYAGGVIRGKQYPAGTYDIVGARGDDKNNYGIVPDRGATRALQNGFVGFSRHTDPVVGGTVPVHCPVDIILIDPDGLTITKDIWEIPGVLYYSIFDIDQDGDLDDLVTIAERKAGNYSITVVPEIGAIPTDTYTLEFILGGETIVLADSRTLAEIPEQPYLVESTEAAVNAAPVSDAGGPYKGVVGKPVTFDPSGSYDPDGQIVLYEWDWDLDGTYDHSGPGPVSEHIWGSVFSGTVRLRVTDNEGLSSTATASVVVEPEPVDSMVILSVGRAAFDAKTKQFSANVTVTNTSNTAIGSPLWLVVESISNPAVTVANASGTTPDGKSYIDLSNALGDGKLSPKEKVIAQVRFHNPKKVAFTFKPSVYGVVLN